MAIRNQKKTENKKAYHCGECRFGQWITDNHRHYDLLGRPICVRCHFTNKYMVRSERACYRFEPKKDLTTGFYPPVELCETK